VVGAELAHHGRYEQPVERVRKALAVPAPRGLGYPHVDGAEAVVGGARGWRIRPGTEAPTVADRTRWWSSPAPATSSVPPLAGPSEADNEKRVWSVCGLPVCRHNLWTTKSGSDCGFMSRVRGDLNPPPLRPERPRAGVGAEVVGDAALLTSIVAISGRDPGWVPGSPDWPGAVQRRAS